MPPDLHAVSPKTSSSELASLDELRPWIQEATGAVVADWKQISGGNRCQSWLVRLSGREEGSSMVYLRYQPPRAPSVEPYTVWREAEIYRAIDATGVPAARLVAVHREHQAIITSALEGGAEFRRLSDESQKTSISLEFVQALAKLHSVPLASLPASDLTACSSIEDCVRQELNIWRSMYEEAGEADQLIELALSWLDSNLPQASEAPVMVHGDAGPGNFLFKDGHLTGLIDWELAHGGDPMEDLAWFAMRCVMEPVPDFSACIAEYETASGRKVDAARLLYFCVFVSTRVVIIRHRNVTGLPGNSIVSRALNRRLLVDALARAEGISLSLPPAMTSGPTERTDLYDGLIDDLKALSETESQEVSAFSKNAAKVLKYLREYDRYGAELDGRLAALFVPLPEGGASSSAAENLRALTDGIASGAQNLGDLLQTYAAICADEAQIAAPSSGRVATRGFPEFIRKLRPE